MDKEIIRNLLITAAQKGSCLTYGEVFSNIGVQSTNATRHELFGILLEIGREEHAKGRPLINALVVNQKGIPGEGFFKDYAKLIRQAAEDNNTIMLKEIFDSIKKTCSDYYTTRKP